MKETIKLSASRIKTAIECSWKYYANYILKLPDIPNDGSKRGTIVHIILENLLLDRRKDIVSEILEHEDPYRIPSIYRLVEKHAKVLGVDDEENMETMREFILTGLKTDFYCIGDGNESVELFPPEKKFQLDNEDPLYSILGFIDKLAYYPKSKILRVVDYKTSKQKFSSEELKFNIQALTYSLAGRKIVPEAKRVIVEFVFLKFKKNPSLKCEFSIDDLDLFEDYLGDMNSLLVSFDEEKGKSSYAADGGFGKSWMCGKKTGDLNKEGKPAWICKYKYPYDYYEASKEGKIIKCEFKKKDLMKEFKGDKSVSIKKKYYTGCPRFKGILF